MTTKNKIKKSPMVIFGASAGGLPTYLTIFKKISPRNNLIYVVIQHLDPSQKSHLADLLKKSTTLPIDVIKNGMKPEINHFYVLPSNFELSWLNGKFKLVPLSKSSKYKHCTIDTFMKSVSKDTDRGLVGVVLSGSNSDGTKGLASIKKSGGVSIVLDPSTTKFPIMPKSAIAENVIDKILPTEKIAAEVNKIAKNLIRDQHEEKNNELAPIFDLLENLTGVDFSQYKQATIQRRINRRMQLNKIQNITAYSTFLKQHPVELKKLFEETTIHVTEFFRDSDSFEMLKKKVLPKIITKLSTQVRVWVPACSTGQEAYSVAMLMLDYIETSRSKTVLKIFATDVSEDSIKRARNGIFSDEEVINIPARFLKKYFSKTNNGYVVTKELRNACVFAKHDLTRDASFSQMDLVCCRNLLIYFNQNNQNKAVQTFYYALKPNGFLFLGSAESLGLLNKQFNTIDWKNRIFSKTLPSKSKSKISIGLSESEIKRATPFLSKSDHDDFIKLAKEFKTKVSKTKETPEKANLRLNKEIKQLHSYFEKLVENQSALYEELQATHEEVLASNEELQTKNEEFEMTQEELQATNEELTSINDEMLDKNQELTKLNEEIEFSKIIVMEEKEYSEAIIDTVRQPIIVLDENLIVQRVNLPFLDIFKVTIKETVGSSLFMLGNNQWDIPALKKMLRDILPHESHFNDFEIEHNFQRIGRKVISLNARQLFLPHLKRKLILLAMEDVTARNLLKDKKRDAFSALEVKKDRSDATVLRLEDERILREKFVSTLSHDLKNPLSAAIMAAHLLIRNPSDVEKTAKLSSRIANSLNRVDGMISDLLDANKIQAGDKIGIKTEEFDARYILHQTIEELISVHGDKFNIIANKPIIIQSDLNGFKRIIENLVSNAVKYGDSQTRIKIVLDTAPGKFFKLNVQNFGSPIAEKDISNIFSQFKRTDLAEQSGKSGWGIGLTLVRGITEALGGEISVKSNEKEGTNFEVKLPINSKSK